jgi:hypothetical protein
VIDHTPIEKRGRPAPILKIEARYTSRPTVCDYQRAVRAAYPELDEYSAKLYGIKLYDRHHPRPRK